jgi:hypothetical protein
MVDTMIDIRKLKQIAEWLEANRETGYSPRMVHENVAHLLSCIHLLMRGRETEWVDGAAKMAMQGLLSSDATFGSDPSVACKSVADWSVRCAVELRASLNRYLESQEPARSPEIPPSTPPA